MACAQSTRVTQVWCELQLHEVRCGNSRVHVFSVQSIWHSVMASEAYSMVYVVRLLHELRPCQATLVMRRLSNSVDCGLHCGVDSQLHWACTMCHVITDM